MGPSNNAAVVRRMMSTQPRNVLAVFTSLLAQGVDYPGVTHVFVMNCYALTDLVQMFGRCARGARGQGRVFLYDNGFVDSKRGLGLESIGYRDDDALTVLGRGSVAAILEEAKQGRCAAAFVARKFLGGVAAPCNRCSGCDGDAGAKDAGAKDARDRDARDRDAGAKDAGAKDARDRDARVPLARRFEGNGGASNKRLQVGVQGPEQRRGRPATQDEAQLVSIWERWFVGFQTRASEQCLLCGVRVTYQNHWANECRGLVGVVPARSCNFCFGPRHTQTRRSELPSPGCCDKRVKGLCWCARQGQRGQGGGGGGVDGQRGRQPRLQRGRPRLQSRGVRWVLYVPMRARAVVVPLSGHAAQPFARNQRVDRLRRILQLVHSAGRLLDWKQDGPELVCGVGVVGGTGRGATGRGWAQRFYDPIRLSPVNFTPHRQLRSSKSAEITHLPHTHAMATGRKRGRIGGEADRAGQENPPPVGRTETLGAAGMMEEEDGSEEAQVKAAAALGMVLRSTDSGLYEVYDLHSSAVRSKVLGVKGFSEAKLLIGQAKIAALDRIADRFEQDLEVVGATAIEDALQEGVPDTIRMLRGGHQGGCSPGTRWNIGFSSKLLDADMHQIFIDGSSTAAARPSSSSSWTST